MDITKTYTALVNGPGPLIARQAVVILTNLRAGSITESEARVAISRVIDRPLTYTDDPDETRRRLADPDIRQWLDWHREYNARGASLARAVINGDEGIERIWKD